MTKPALPITVKNAFIDVESTLEEWFSNNDDFINLGQPFRQKSVPASRIKRQLLDCMQLQSSKYNSSYAIGAEKKLEFLEENWTTDLASEPEKEPLQRGKQFEVVHGRTTTSGLKLSSGEPNNLSMTCWEVSSDLDEADTDAAAWGMFTGARTNMCPTNGSWCSQLGEVPATQIAAGNIQEAFASAHRARVMANTTAAAKDVNVKVDKFKTSDKPRIKTTPITENINGASILNDTGVAVPEEWSNISTIMMRNLPNKYSQEMLVNEIHQAGFEGCYDFLYLPIDAELKANKGYAFINMIDPTYAWQFRILFQGQKMQSFNSHKKVSVDPAVLQGFDANYSHYAGAHVNRKEVTARPLFLRQPAQFSAKKSRSRPQGGQSRLKEVKETPRLQQSVCRTPQGFDVDQVQQAVRAASRPSNQVTLTVRFCPFCGVPVQGTYNFCTACGKCLRNVNEIPESQVDHINNIPQSQVDRINYIPQSQVDHTFALRF